MKDSQCQRIIEYMNQGHVITALEALTLFDCLRLAARIKDLKDEGYVIYSEDFKDEKTGKRYAKYYTKPTGFENGGQTNF